MREEQVLSYLKGACPGRKYRVGGAELERVLDISGTDLRKQVNRLKRRGVPIGSNRCGCFYAVTAGMEPKALPAYKALLEAVDCKSVQQAEQLMDTLDEYIFSPQFSSPIEVAKGELSIILTEQDAALITPHLNLYQYGQSLIQRDNGVLTDYGLIERRDGQPVQTIEQPRQGGMEMM